MTTDWLNDSSLTVEEKLQRFIGLEPQPTRGPKPDQYWNYRMTRELINGEHVYAIREIYYMKEKPYSWSKDPVNLGGGESPDDIAKDMGLMVDAIANPVWDIDRRRWIE